MASCAKCGQWVEDVTTADGRRQIASPLVAVTVAEDGDEVVTRDGQVVRGVVAPGLAQAPPGSRLGRLVHTCPSGRARVGVLAGVVGGLLLVGCLVAVLHEAHGLGVALGAVVLGGWMALTAWDEWRGEVQ